MTRAVMEDFFSYLSTTSRIKFLRKHHNHTLGSTLKKTRQKKITKLYCSVNGIPTVVILNIPQNIVIERIEIYSHEKDVFVQ